MAARRERDRAFYIAIADDPAAYDIITLPADVPLDRGAFGHECGAVTPAVMAVSSLCAHLDIPAESPES